MSSYWTDAGTRYVISGCGCCPFCFHSDILKISPRCILLDKGIKKDKDFNTATIRDCPLRVSLKVYFELHTYSGRGDLKDGDKVFK